MNEEDNKAVSDMKIVVLNKKKSSMIECYGQWRLGSYTLWGSGRVLKTWSLWCRPIVRGNKIEELEKKMKGDKNWRKGIAIRPSRRIKLPSARKVFELYNESRK